jgi:large subunit ribosomal protein L18
MSLRTVKKRRAEGKTDYYARKNLIKSDIPRIVIRKTNRYLVMQVVTTKESQDKVMITLSSKELLKKGLNEKIAGSLKSLPASYITGLLMAKKIKKGEYIVDMGMAINHSGGRIYAAVKGLVDGGIKVRANPEIFPSEDRLSGEHMKKEIREEFDKLKKTILKGDK